MWSRVRSFSTTAVCLPCEPSLHHAMDNTWSYQIFFIWFGEWKWVCHSASHLHHLTDKIIYFHMIMDQALLFVLSTYFPVIHKCLYYPHTSVYLCIHLCLALEIPELEKQRQAHLWGSLTCQLSLLRLQAGERHDGWGCSLTSTRTYVNVHTQGGRKEVVQTCIRRTGVNVNTVTGVMVPTAGLQW